MTPSFRTGRSTNLLLTLLALVLVATAELAIWGAVSDGTSCLLAHCAVLAECPVGQDDARGSHRPDVGYQAPHHSRQSPGPLWRGGDDDHDVALASGNSVHGDR